jgi:hypothetical protein
MIQSKISINGLDIGNRKFAFFQIKRKSGKSLFVKRDMEVSASELETAIVLKEIKREPKRTIN